MFETICDHDFAQGRPALPQLSAILNKAAKARMAFLQRPP